MRVRFLLDENLDPRLKAGLLRRDPVIDVLCVGDPEAPPWATPDPDILRYVERTQRLLITNNRISMATHVANHLAAGGRHWGVFRTSRRATIGWLVEDAYLLWTASEADEWIDQMRWLPL